MHILILGGGGFLGQKLAKQLITNQSITVNGVPGQITKIELLDRFWPQHKVEDPILIYTQGDITDEAVVQYALNAKPHVIFQLAAIVSGEAEKNFDLGMQVNLLANLRLLEMIRTMGTRPVVVFASTCAAFGGEVSRVIDDFTAPAPQSSYGTQKVMTELLINDYSRKGFFHGRVLRLPTIVVRPGKANAATSSFVSSIIREPLQGLAANCPVSEDVNVWILSPRAVTYNFIHAAGLTNAQLGTKRIINLPGNTIQIKDMVTALDDIAGSPVSQWIDWTPDAFIQSIVLTWPPFFKTAWADHLGFIKDESIQDIIKGFIEDELCGRVISR
ncbi:MAG: NAD-dependent epimerase/dehydratase family protein [Saprospiraceae bacterium]|nr:NAD-dependent epimerase/dehydratase family protein [Saprospiraceae bacterium]